MKEYPTKYHKWFEKDLFAKTSGIELVDASPGYAKASMNIDERHLNGVDVVHGGAIFTLADFAFAVASNSHGNVALAINAEISYFKAVSSGSLVAVAKEISRSRSLGTYLIDVFNEKGELIANLKGTVFRKNEAIDFD
jgi:acyl-CoA thioesterase